MSTDVGTRTTTPPERQIQTCYVKRDGVWVWAGFRRKPVVVAKPEVERGN